MILTGTEITRAVDQGEIIISPFSADMINPNSYNYHISQDLYVVEDETIDPKVEYALKKIEFSKEGYVLLPGRIYLGSTQEIIGSDHYVISLIGRSSIGRLGLFLQITADLGQLGTCHMWTLELTVVQPLRVYPGMCIGQVSFWKPIGSIEYMYDGGYSKYSFPQKSQMYKTYDPNRK